MKRVTIMNKETPQRGFTEWLEHIGSVHRANKPAVERALQRLADDDQAAATPRRVDDRTKALTSVVTIDRAFDFDNTHRRQCLICPNANNARG
jgi:hypothetical protein